MGVPAGEKRMKGERRPLEAAGRSRGAENEGINVARIIEIEKEKLVSDIAAAKRAG